jgi:hypothetical protein
LYEQRTAPKWGLERGVKVNVTYGALRVSRCFLPAAVDIAAVLDD